MTRRQDADLKGMTPAQLRREIARLRGAIRKHRDLEENERCWHCDLQLYSALPEQEAAGQMRGDAQTLLRRCIGYICRQQCVLFGCDGRLATRRSMGRVITRIFRIFDRAA